MRPTVYIEITVISYRMARPSRDLIIAAHQQITHEWWDTKFWEILGTAYLIPTKHSAGELQMFALGDNDMGA